MKKPFVGILMGSDSDLPVMKDAAIILEDFGIGAEVKVLSAHRTPDQVVEYIHDAEKRGAKAFIGAAGMSAALPGTIAAHTALPVIGVPLSSANSAGGGIDAILSVTQMPPGVPVAGVALNGAKNAGVLAAEIIGAGDPDVHKKVVAYKKKLEEDALAKSQKIEKTGFQKYLEGKGPL